MAAKKEKMLTDRIYYADCTMERPQDRDAVEHGRVAPTNETILRAHILSDNLQDAPNSKIKRPEGLLLLLQPRPNEQSRQFYTSNLGDITALLKDYQIEKVKDLWQLQGKSIGVYICYHQAVAVSPVVENGTK